MDLVVVVPDEPLSQITVLLLDAIGGMKVHIEATILESVMKLLDLPVVLGMVGFVPDMSDPGESAGD